MRIRSVTRFRVPLILNFLLISSAIFFSACSELQRPKVEPFYAKTVPPPKQELRWSNGKMPKSLDPAHASAAPETDLIRAVYEGLTDIDSQTLREVPGVAERWESSADLRTWTFHFRKDARWSNGDRVTAADFVRSWRRLANLNEISASSNLFQNIVGMHKKRSDDSTPPEPPDFLNDSPSETDPLNDGTLPGDDSLPLSQISPLATPDAPAPGSDKNKPLTADFGARAIDEYTLRVDLVHPDKDFPKLVSNPIFRPVHGNGEKVAGSRLDASAVTNGAFKITKIEDDGISLERSENYWNRKSVALERVRFVTPNTAEAALAAYRRGEVDVITNAGFEPLGLKLLAPYEDFRRTTHGALNFYEFNTTKPPFDDRRVREALAIAIDRAKLTEGDLEGTTEPANRFLPVSTAKDLSVAFDAARAKELLENAGYADGAGFPVVRLVINRNNTQNRVARSVARMWKQNLGIETNIVIRETTEIESVRTSGGFDLIRRGVVLAANDELVNLFSIFGSVDKPLEKRGQENPTVPPPTAQSEETGDVPSPDPGAIDTTVSTLTEEDAIFELRAIPLYFPTSYSLVKPYVLGFETNGLDAASLKDVRINNEWKP